MFMKYPRLHRSLIAAFIVCCLQLLTAGTFAQYRYTITGKLTGGAGKTLYFSPDTYVPNTEKQQYDSIVIGNDDSIRLSGENKYAGLYSIFIKGQKPFLVFFLDTTPVAISGNSEAIYRSNISGAADQELMTGFQAQDGVVQQQLETNLNKAQQLMRQQPVDTQQVIVYRKKLDSLNRIRAANISNFMINHPTAYQTFQNIETFLGNLVSYDTAEKYLADLPQKYAANPVFTKISRLVTGYKASSPGAILPDISLPDTTGNNLVSFKKLQATNKYILIDFWASWCVPCRANNPALQQLYRRYKQRQFEIAGISLDENMDNWKKAIRKDNMKWIQLSDLKGMNNEYALQLGIKTIPTYILIDSSGKLLLKTHKVQDIEEKMKQLSKHIHFH